jgi:L-asparaginase
MTRDGRRRIAVVSTGGTIANTPDGRLSIDDVIDTIETRHPAVVIRDRFELVVEEVEREAAEAFTPQTWLGIAAAVQRWSDRDDIDAVLVTHGTYTVEETAYFLHLTVDTVKPLVLTCSQRKHSTLGNDGDHNLVDALRVASDPAAAGLGALLVVHEEVHSGRDVVKVSRRPGGFSSPALGPLGSVDEDRVSLYRRPIRQHTATSELRRKAPAVMPAVEVVAAHPGATAATVDAAVARGAAGIVIQGYAFSGRPGPEQLAAAEQAAEQGVAVVLASRGGEGRIPVPAVKDRFVRADNLATSKAFVLLTTALAAGIEGRDALQAVFDTH